MAMFSTMVRPISPSTLSVLDFHSFSREMSQFLINISMALLAHDETEIIDRRSTWYPSYLLRSQICTLAETQITYILFQHKHNFSWIFVVFYGLILLLNLKDMHISLGLIYTEPTLYI